MSSLFAVGLFSVFSLGHQATYRSYLVRPILINVDIIPAQINIAATIRAIVIHTGND